jgi:5S rRNA maturation endonuclease (ribonuclease M5)
MSENTDYIRETLYPALYKNLDKVFPEMEFKKRSTRWISSHYINGVKTQGQHYQPDKTWVGEKVIANLCENGSGARIDLLTFYMEQNGVTNLYEAERQIAKIVNVPPPPESEESKAKAKADKEKAEILFLSYERQKKALFSPEGAEVLRYLKEDRGYPEDLIRKMGLGYLSEKEGNFLEQRLQIGYSPYFKDFPLSIPYFSKGSLLGFKLRYISKEAKQKYGNGKYRNPTGFDGIMNYNPFNLPPFRVNLGTKKERTVIVVEGELDALHAREKGIENVIAASGGNGISKEKANTIAEWGYNSVILTLDTDKAGQKQTVDSIEILLNKGLKVYVATLPDGKDTDEFLKTHTAEEYKAVIAECTQAVYYLFKKEVDKFNSTARTPIDFDKFQDNVIELSLRTKDEVLRGRILDSLKDAFGVSGEEAYKGYRAKADRLKAEKEKKEALQKSDEALKEATRLLSIGNKDKAKEKTKEALDKLKTAEGEDKYSFLLKDNTDELWERYKNPPKTFDTGFILSIALKTKKDDKERVNVPYRLSFPAGAISVIGAFTNHGKSKILQSIALDGLKADWEDGIMLYFTYEENEENVNIQFLNAYTDIELTKKAKNIPNAGNFRTIKDYLYNGDTTFFKKEKEESGLTPLEIFRKAEEEWKNIRKEGRIRIIKPESNTLEELIDILKYAKEHLPIRAVFLDYIQELYLDDTKRIGSRPDELKKIMVDLDLFAQEANIPIIAAAQLGRAVGGPGGLCNQIISDSGWIERKASEIVLIWSSNGEKDKESGDLKKLQEIVGFQYAEIFQKEEEGYLFLKLTKSRTIPKGAKAVVEIHGNSGRVQRNGDLPKPPEARQMEMGFSETEIKIDPEAQRPYRRSREEKETETPATYTENKTDEASRNSGGSISIEEPPIDPFTPFPPPGENEEDLPF